MHGGNDLLTGWENRNLVRWYAVIFRNEMVLAYNPKSRFAARLAQARAGPLSVYRVLEQRGYRFLLSSEGRAIPETHGLPRIRPLIHADRGAVPAGLHAVLEGNGAQ